MNKAILMGRLTKDPEIKTTPSNISVCTFTLAVNRRFKNSEGNYDTDFINCVAWRQTAEFISKFFSKGSMMGICGSIQTRNYEKDGRTIYVTEVIADEAYFTGSKASDTPNDTSNEAGGNNDVSVPMPYDDDDLPF